MLIANKIIEACLIFSYGSSLPVPECNLNSSKKLHETVMDFVDDMLKDSGMDKQYAWNCLGSLKYFFLQDGNYGGDKKCTDIFSKIYVDKMVVVTGTSDRNCPDLFSSMKTYKKLYDSNDSKKCSPVSKAFNVTHPFLKKCHKIVKESQLRSNVGR